MPARYRAVVVGCGRIGSGLSFDAREPGTHSHAQAYREHGRIELVGVADPDQVRLDAAAAAWSVSADRDASALCASLRPDIVSVCTPDGTHIDVARGILRAAAPRLLFIEKPLASTTADAEALAAEARRSGTAIAVNHTRRYVPAFRTIADELRSGVHGTPYLARGLYGKGLTHNGVHAIDLLRLWLGDPSEVHGRAAAWGPPNDETWDLDLLFGHVRARLDAADERVATIFEMEVLAERSRIRFWDGGDRWEFSTASESARYAGYRAYVPNDRADRDPLFSRPLATALHHAVEDIVRSLDGEGALLCDAAEAIATLRVIERLRPA